MGRIVIVCYKPKSGKEKELEGLSKTDIDRLKKENLVTNRQPIIMKSQDGCIIEVFEWKSKEAIEQAERDAQAKIEAERQRALKAEQDAKDAAEKAERDRIAAIERAKIAEENAEKARLEAIKQAEIDKKAAIELAIRQSEERARLEKLATDKKAAEEKAQADIAAADRHHQKNINGQIVLAFNNLGWTNDEAKAIVKAVATKKIPFMVIKY